MARRGRPPGVSRNLPARIETVQRRKELLEESLLQAQAFEFYYSLGEKRVYKPVCEKFSLSASTISTWSVRHKWSSRVAERDRDIADRLQYETAEETLVRRKNVLKIIDLCIDGKLVKDDVGRITGVRGIDFKSVGELRDFLELAERILNPSSASKGSPVARLPGGGANILINITK